MPSFTLESFVDALVAAAALSDKYGQRCAVNIGRPAPGRYVVEVTDFEFTSQALVKEVQNTVEAALDGLPLQESA